MDLWYIITIVDWTLFAVVAIAVGYLTVFAIASLFSKHPHVPEAKQQNRFIVLIPSYKADKGVMDTVKSILGQSYPQRQFDVVVISDHQEEMTNFRLAQFPITLLTPNFHHSTKGRSLQYAINNLPAFKIYDIVVILDAGTIVGTEFLHEMNNAFENAGTKAIQAHRLSKNRDTAIAHLDATFEEINNSIFRRGHITLGLSSALSGSGYAFDFEWFRENIFSIKSTYFDKEMESLLLRQHAYIDYFDDILVYDEKTRYTKDFNEQRTRWASTQFHAALSNIRYLPQAIINQQYSWIDKLVQWMIVPRTIMMAIIAIMSFVMPIIYFTLSIKWWATFAWVLFVFALATPDYLVDKNWNNSFLRSPFIMLGALFNQTKVVKSDKSYVNKSTN